MREPTIRLKKIIKGNKKLFYLWFFLFRKKRTKLNFFDKETAYMVDGFPRSGNTFCTHLAKNFFGGNNVIHHFHAIAPIKIAQKRNLPVFILLRDPKDAISSYYLKKLVTHEMNIPKETDITLLKELAGEYVDYYTFTEVQKNELNFVDFNQLIQAPIEIVKKINEAVFDNYFKIDDGVLDQITNSYKGATDTYGSDTPNAEKEILKNNLKKELVLLPQYKQAEEIYKRLL